MNPQAAQNYLRTKVLTASPEQLQLMLFDGAIRFGEQARLALLQNNFEQSHGLIEKAQKILNELSTSLKRDIDPDLCGKLAGLYAFAYRRLIDADVKHDVKAIDEALNVIKYQRETWTLLLDRLNKEKAGLAARKIDLPAPSDRMEASISMQG